MLQRKMIRISAIALIFILAVSGCASKPAPAKEQNGQGKAAPPAAKTKVTMVQAANLLVFAPIYVAKEKGYFQDEGIEVEMTMLTSAATAVNAVVGGSADFGAVATINFAQSVDKDLPLEAVFNLNNRLTSDVIFRTDLAKEKGLSRNTPLKDRYAALKGLIIGVPSPGSYADLFIRYLLAKAGLNPDKDVQIVNIGENYVPAMQAKHIDVTVVSPPVGQAAEFNGIGTIVISNTLGDIPELRTWANQIMIVKKDYAKQHPEVVQRVNKALAKALLFIQNNPDEANKVLQNSFKDTPPEVITKAMEQLKGSFQQDGKLTKEIWDTISGFMADAKMIQKPLDTKEGGFWTNEFVPASK